MSTGRELVSEKRSEKLEEDEVASEALQCYLVCGGQDCQWEGPRPWPECDQAVKGLFSHWVTPDILAMSRPNTRLLREGTLLEDFKREGVYTVINLQVRGEHGQCGPGLEQSGFTYCPEDFINNGVNVHHCGWPDRTAPPLPHLLDTVKLLDRSLGVGRVAVHCHAGVGRTGVVIASWLVFSQRLEGPKAVEIVRSKRPASLRNHKQIQKVYEFASFLAPLWTFFPPILRPLSPTPSRTPSPTPRSSIASSSATPNQSPRTSLTSSHAPIASFPNQTSFTSSPTPSPAPISSIASSSPTPSHSPMTSSHTPIFSIASSNPTPSRSPRTSLTSSPTPSPAPCSLGVEDLVRNQALILHTQQEEHIPKVVAELCGRLQVILLLNQSGESINTDGCGLWGVLENWAVGGVPDDHTYAKMRNIKEEMNSRLDWELLDSEPSPAPLLYLLSIFLHSLKAPLLTFRQEVACLLPPDNDEDTSQHSDEDMSLSKERFHTALRIIDTMGTLLHRAHHEAPPPTVGGVATEALQELVAGKVIADMTQDWQEGQPQLELESDTDYLGLLIKHWNQTHCTTSD